MAAKRGHVGWYPSAIVGAVTIWRPPYRDPFRAVTAFVAMFASVFAFAFVGAVFTSHPPVLAAVGVVPLMALVATFAWRLHRTALVTSDRGVRVRWPLKTRTVGWQEIKRFRFGVDVMAIDRLWIDLDDGRRIRTPVQRVPRFAGLFGLRDGGTRLRSGACEELLRVLDQQLQASRPRRSRLASRPSYPALGEIWETILLPGAFGDHRRLTPTNAVASAGTWLPCRTLLPNLVMRQGIGRGVRGAWCGCVA